MIQMNSLLALMRLIIIIALDFEHRVTKRTRLLYLSNPTFILSDGLCFWLGILLWRSEQKKYACGFAVANLIALIAHVSSQIIILIETKDSKLYIVGWISSLSICIFCDVVAMFQVRAIYMRLHKRKNTSLY